MVDKINMSKAVLCLGDCTGLLGFDIPKEMSGWALLRADRNRHKHCVLFAVELTAKQKSDVRAFISHGRTADALLYLRWCAHGVGRVGYPAGRESFRQSFGKIPNPDLYPFDE